MTDFELTKWTGDDAAGPYMISFGHIDTTMEWSRISTDAEVIGHGTCTEVDADTFTYSKSSKKKGLNLFASGFVPGENIDWSITGDVLTLVQDGITVKMRQVTI